MVSESIHDEVRARYADAALQPYVAEAREALRRLASEDGGAPR